MKILVGSPIHQTPQILSEFLLSLVELDKINLQVDYCFVDDNKEKESSELLKNFQSTYDNVVIFSSDYDSQYVCDDFTHRWNNDLVDKVTEFKNRIINFAVKKDYDYLFFIDSDIVLHPKALKRLLETKKDIVSNIFWTKWNPNAQELPQVWLKDAYTLYDAKSNVPITQDDMNREIQNFLNMLKKPGTYLVGGLGACTLISKKALVAGVNFSPVYNLSFWGEDRAFCVRAVVLGFELFVDTYYPAYHIYRTEDLNGVSAYKLKSHKRDLEIIGSGIFDKITTAIEKLETYSYETCEHSNWHEYFVKDEMYKQNMRIKKEINKCTQDNVIRRTKIMECKLNFYSSMDKVNAKLQLSISGYKNNISFYKEQFAKCTAIKEKDGQWRINSFEFEKEKLVPNLPLIRKAKKDSKLTLSMIVKNEADRYLIPALTAHREYINNAVIIDDGSTDNSVAICKDLLNGIELKIIENKSSKFHNEILLRKQQWNETIQTNPDWILPLDADEIFEDRFKDEIKELIQNIDVDLYAFRMYDFWNKTHYRDDTHWSAHNIYRPFMLRYQRNFKYVWKEISQHCGRMPQNVFTLPYEKSECRLKHYGWATLEDRIAKYERYMKLDPNGKHGSLPQYNSILDKNPNLVKWIE